MIWRIVASDIFKATLVEVERDWTLLDCMQAHDILDAVSAFEPEK